ncbi:hypothetical protein LT330_004965 [Penicillium expansum]|nr:hypothetical protein LT330_004965 [Penicillium expansum]
MSAFKSYDDYAWAISSQIWKDWPKLLRTDEDIKNNIQVILSEEFRDIECLRFHFLHTGGFNTCFKMDFTNHCGAIIWFPLPGAIIFPKRKEVKPIEEYVELKLEEKKEEKKKRNLTWDVDEYTKEWMERMIKKRKKEMEREETFA